MRRGMTSLSVVMCCGRGAQPLLLLLTAYNSLLHTAHCLLPTICSLQLTCLLPTAYSVLPRAYWSLPAGCWCRRAPFSHSGTDSYTRRRSSLFPRGVQPTYDTTTRYTAPQDAIAPSAWLTREFCLKFLPTPLQPNPPQPNSAHFLPGAQAPPCVLEAFAVV